MLVLGTFTGTVFYQLSKNPTQRDMDLRKSISFIAVLAMALGAMAQIPSQIDERVVSARIEREFEWDPVSK